MNIGTWATKWNISDEAIEELQRFMWDVPTVRKQGLSEAGITSLVKLEASVKGCRLWRNNVGAAYMKDGSFIRYGLANESTAMNSRIKSADLIGIRPVKITTAHVGQVIGQFLSREIKASDWKYSASPHEQAQLHWIELIKVFGGDASFANGGDTI